MLMPIIETRHLSPAIHTHAMDWMAVDIDRERSPVGWGSSEDAAVKDLLRQLEERR